METIYKWILVDDYGDVIGTNSDEKAEEFSHYDKWTVINTHTSSIHYDGCVAKMAEAK